MPEIVSLEGYGDHEEVSESPHATKRQGRPPRATDPKPSSPSGPTALARAERTNRRASLQISSTNWAGIEHGIAVTFSTHRYCHYNVIRNSGGRCRFPSGSRDIQRNLGRAATKDQANSCKMTGKIWNFSTAARLPLTHG